MKTDATVALQAELDTQELEVDTMRIDMLAVGNRCGLNITTKLALIETCPGCNPRFRRAIKGRWHPRFPRWRTDYAE